MEIRSKVNTLVLMLTMLLVGATAFAQEVDIGAAQGAVLAILGIGAAVVAARTIYRMTRKGAGEASV